MSQLARSRIRLACDARSKSQIKDTFTGASPDGWNSNDTQIEIGIFDAGALVTDISNIQSLTVAINDVTDRKTAVITPITVAAGSLDGTVTEETWADGTKQHALIPLTNAEFNFDLGGKTEKTFWLAVYVTTTDVPARTYTVGTSILRILEDGTPPTGAPTPGDPLYLDAAQSDARYLGFPAFSARKTIAQAVFGSGSSLVEFNSIEYAIEGGFSTVTHRYTVPRQGRYRLSGYVKFSVLSALTNVAAEIWKNGLFHREVMQDYKSESGDFGFPFHVDVQALGVGDYFELYVYHDSDDPQTVASAYFQGSLLP